MNRTGFWSVLLFGLWVQIIQDHGINTSSHGSIQLHPVALVFCILHVSQRQTAMNRWLLGFSLDFFRIIASIVDIGWQKPVCKNSDCQLVDAFQWNPWLNQIQSLNLQLGRSWSSELYNPCPGVMEGAPWQRNLTRTTWRITWTTSSYQFVIIIGCSTSPFLLVIIIIYLNFSQKHLRCLGSRLVV